MKKVLFVLLLGSLLLTGCNKENKPVPQPNIEIVEPGVEAPEGWPEDVPTPDVGEFLWGDWSEGGEMYTVDIKYAQEDIDNYKAKLQNAGFAKIDTDKYVDIYGDAEVFANAMFEVVVGDEGVNGDYTYISIYPILMPAVE